MSSTVPPPPTRIEACSEVISVSRQPAAARIGRSRSGSANANMPGPPAGTGAGGGRCSARAAPGTSSHWLAASGCQHANTSRPPGRVADLMLAKAATGSAKNITPKREMTMSKPAGSSDSTCASPCRNVTLARPAASASARARASIGPDRSRPSAWPGATSRAAASVVPPQPQPTSSTFPPGRRAAASRIRAVNGACMRS